MKAMFYVWPELVKSTRELVWTVNSSDIYAPLKITSSSIEAHNFVIENDRSFTASNNNDPDQIESKNIFENVLAIKKKKLDY